MHISDRLIEIATFYNSEARRCVKSRGYLAASIMQVSALEAALQAMCFLYPKEVKRTTPREYALTYGRINRVAVSACLGVSVMSNKKADVIHKSLSYKLDPCDQCRHVSWFVRI